MGEKMVIVVGAGASRDFGLPMGTELKERIATSSSFLINGHKIVANDPFTRDLVEVCSRVGGKQRQVYVDAFISISEALPLAPSIDNYLDIHNGDATLVECGKMGIVREILMAERKSNLFHEEDQFYAKAVEKTWLAEFFRMVTEGCPLRDISDRLRGITFVIFNYDRCVEHFLYHALQTYYRIPDNQAATILSGVSFLHPYGTLGNLPWQDGTRSVGFGESVFAEKLINLSGGILTFTESHNIHISDLAKIHRSIITAPMLIFLGFAFHRINMRLLFSNLGKNMPKKIFATALGISQSDRNHISAELLSIFKGQHELRGDLMCNQIFSEYSKAISLATE